MVTGGAPTLTGEPAIGYEAVADGAGAYEATGHGSSYALECFDAGGGPGFGSVLDERLLERASGTQGCLEPDHLQRAADRELPVALTDALARYRQTGQRHTQCSRHRHSSQRFGPATPDQP
jgi:hypothetical protein